MSGYRPQGISRNYGFCGGGLALIAVDGVRNDGIMECSTLRDSTSDGGGTIGMSSTRCIGVIIGGEAVPERGDTVDIVPVLVVMWS